MRRWFFVLAILAGPLFLSACARPPIEKAVRGDLLPTEENVVVVNHCQSCHVHVAFKAEPHVEKVRMLYAQGHPLREANRCLQCHSLSLENMFRDERRGTKQPHGKLLDIADIPKPSQETKAPAKGGKSAAEKPEEQKRRWYFFYLF